MKKVKLRICALDEQNKLKVLLTGPIEVEAPIRVAVRAIASDGYSTGQVNEGDLDYYPPHRILKVTAMCNNNEVPTP